MSRPRTFTSAAQAPTAISPTHSNAAGVQSVQIASRTIDLTQPVSNGTTSISGDSLLVLLNNGQVYTNGHTATNPNGEIRGQIMRTQSSNDY